MHAFAIACKAVEGRRLDAGECPDILSANLYTPRLSMANNAVRAIFFELEYSCLNVCACVCVSSLVTNSPSLVQDADLHTASIGRTTS